MSAAVWRAIARQRPSPPPWEVGGPVGVAARGAADARHPSRLRRGDVWSHRRLVAPRRDVPSFGGTGDPLKVRLRDLSLKHGRLALAAGAVARVVVRRIAANAMSSGQPWRQRSASRRARGKVLLWKRTRGWHNDRGFVRRQCLGRSGLKVLFSARVPGWLGIDILAL